MVNTQGTQSRAFRPNLSLYSPQKITESTSGINAARAKYMSHLEEYLDLMKHFSAFDGLNRLVRNCVKNPDLTFTSAHQNPVTEISQLNIYTWEFDQ